MIATGPTILVDVLPTGTVNLFLTVFNVIISFHYRAQENGMRFIDSNWSAADKSFFRLLIQPTYYSRGVSWSF